MVLLRRSCNVVEDTLLRIPVEGKVRVRGVGLELALGYPHEVRGRGRDRGR